MTELPINPNKPTIMHIDLNSCFATVEQQAYVHLRNKPVIVAAYSTPNGFVLSPSIEAKQRGIKMGMSVREARLVCPEVIVRTPDAPMIRDVHKKFREIFSDYSPKVIPKSIDEAVLDFTGMERVIHRPLLDVGRDIKQRMRREIGEWISCSVGLGTNRFLAKTAASYQKPDGLVEITHQNLRKILGDMTLLDLNGINVRYEARLNICGIFTPLQLLDTSLPVLEKQVFKSIGGYYWYLRMRGWEIDDVEFKRKTYGQEYSLGATANAVELSSILMKLCEKMGRRLRRSGQAAQGIHVAMVYNDWTHWHQGKRVGTDMYTTQELYKQAQLVFNRRPWDKPIRKLAVNCYDLVPGKNSQIGLFDVEPDKKRNVSDAMDKINDRYGEFVITPALMMSMDDIVLDRIAFGNVKEL